MDPSETPTTYTVYHTTDIWTEYSEYVYFDH